MSGIQESLAGRVAILDMLGFSYKETIDKAFSGGPFLPSMDLIRHPPPHKPLTGPEVFKIIWDGSFPKLFASKGTDRKRFFSSYVQTYIARDVKDFYNIEQNMTLYPMKVKNSHAQRGRYGKFQNPGKTRGKNRNRGGVLPVSENYSPTCAGLYCGPRLGNIRGV
jgi:hypothetical protein